MSDISFRQKASNILRNFHRNSCYPEADEGSLEAALDALDRARLEQERDEAVTLQMHAEAKAVLATKARAADKALLEEAERVLEPFAGEKMPNLRRTRIDYDRHGLRRCISDMELAMARASATLTKLKERRDA